MHSEENNKSITLAQNLIKKCHRFGEISLAIFLKRKSGSPAAASHGTSSRCPLKPREPSSYKCLLFALARRKSKAAERLKLLKANFRSEEIGGRSMKIHHRPATYMCENQIINIPPAPGRHRRLIPERPRAGLLFMGLSREFDDVCRARY